MGRWANWLDVPRHSLSALVGVVVAQGRAVAQGRDNAEAIRLLRPGIGLAAEYAAREAAGRGEYLDEDDLYPDVRPALTGLRDAGLRVLLRALNLSADANATSGDWDVAKPPAAFSARVVDVAQAEPHQIVYVGDHPANGIGPASAAGLRTAHLRRGPWGHLWADTPEAAAADWRIDSLHELGAVAAR